MMTHINLNAEGLLNRRTFLGATTLGMAGWKGEVIAQSDVLRKKGLSCILLFLKGGPSQLETFDPKPGMPTGGPTKSIATSTPGLRIADGWPKTAKVMKHVSLVRTITNTVAEHSRAVYQMHTGYIPMGGVKFPSFGSTVSKEFVRPNNDIPSFVSIGTSGDTIGAGFLGMTYAPLVVNDPSVMPKNVTISNKIDVDRFSRRLSLLSDLENQYSIMGAKSRVVDHKAIYSNAANLIQSPNLKCFEINKEEDKVRETYGKSSVGNGCLLARRLIEQGVSFVEVESGNWDTHYDHFDRIKPLNSETDQAFAALIEDLNQRGILDKTLVILMGEFGRTPTINPRQGRDHFPKAFSMILAGAGIKGGFVLGETTHDGKEIKNNPVTIKNIFCTFCKALKINPRKENLGPLNRPIKIMDEGVAEKALFK